MNNTIKNLRSPTGTKESDGMIKLAVKFKPDVFRQLKERAIRDKKHFSSVVNDVLECGLLDLEDQERDEPTSSEKLSVICSQNEGVVS